MVELRVFHFGTRIGGTVGLRVDCSIELNGAAERAGTAAIAGVANKRQHVNNHAIGDAGAGIGVDADKVGVIGDHLIDISHLGGGALIDAEAVVNLHSVFEVTKRARRVEACWLRVAIVSDGVRTHRFAH